MAWVMNVSTKQIFAFVLLLLAACTPTAVVSPQDRLASNVAVSPDYRLGVGDRVRITVYNETGLSGEFAVGDNGNLSLPLVGDVSATGQTTGALSALIQQKLADGYLREPSVSVEVASYRPFFILGEVRAPGQYPYASGLTVMNAVATAQGFTPRAERAVVFVRSFGSGEEKAYKLIPDLAVLPGDTIRIGERYF